MNAQNYIRQLRLYDILGYTNDYRIKKLVDYINTNLLTLKKVKSFNNICTFVYKNSDDYTIISTETDIVVFDYSNCWKHIQDITDIQDYFQMEELTSYISKYYLKHHIEKTTYKDLNFDKWWYKYAD